MLRSLLWCAALVPALPAATATTSHAQRPTAAVVSRVDVGGTEALDEVRIDEDGSIAVHISGDDSAGAWTPLAASGKVVGGSIHVDRKVADGRTIILAISKLGRRGRHSFTEAVALAWSPGKLEPLWRGKLGAQGVDGGTTLSIELGKYGLIKYSSRAGVARCDGETAYLDSERYDFGSGKFRPARQPARMGIANDRPPLTSSSARPDFIPEDSAPFWFRAAGASSSGTAASAGELVPPAALTDGNDATAWTENKGGAGAGEFVTLRTRMGEVNVKALRLSLGHGADRNAYGRPKRLGLILSNSEKFWIDIPRDPGTAQWVTLPAPVASECVTLVLDSVYPKRTLAQTAISEISIYSEEELDPARSASLLAARIAKGKAGADTARLLGRLGPNAASALLTAIADARSSERPGKEKEIVNLRMALASIPAAPEELVAGLADDALQSRHHDAFAGALESIASQAAAPLASALTTSSPLAAERIATVLGRIPDAAAKRALLDALGAGSERTRTATIRALADRKDVWSPLAIPPLPSLAPLARADMLRAMGMAGGRLPVDTPERTAIANALFGVSELATKTYEEHYRFLQAAGILGGAGGLSELLNHATKLASRRDAEGLALLRRAVESIAQLAKARIGEPEGSKITAALSAALIHEDPGVRLALLAALDANTAPKGGIEDRLKNDAWPEVRRAAAASLSTRCDASSIEALRAATLEDDNTKVARSAFGALLGCGAKERYALALQLVDVDDRPLELRLHAARMLGELASVNDSQAIIDRFAKARRGALSSRKSGKLASALTRALADIGTPEAVGALEKAAADPAFPELQAASITALGTLCPKSSRQLLLRLRESREASVAAAATRAARQCSP